MVTIVSPCSFHIWWQSSVLALPRIFPSDLVHKMRLYNIIIVPYLLSKEFHWSDLEANYARDKY